VACIGMKNGGWFGAYFCLQGSLEGGLGSVG